jgi:mRNA interferase MazF
MQRGEIWLVDLEPARGTEANKRRPAVIVSNNGANAAASRLGRGIVTVVPVTSNTSRIYPFRVLLPAATTRSAGGAGLAQDSKAQAEQVRSVSLDRVTHRIGYLSGASLAQLDEALRIHLAL